MSNDAATLDLSVPFEQLVLCSGIIDWYSKRVLLALRALSCWDRDVSS